MMHDVPDPPPVSCASASGDRHGDGLGAGDFTVIATDLVKCFTGSEGKPFQALDQINLKVRAGRLTALVGPDGAGKTTMIRMICGLIKPDDGKLTVLGHDVSTHPSAVQDRISYMPQRFGLYEDLSVQENLDLYADLHGVPQRIRAERFRSMLQMVDMQNFVHRLAGKLSGGMKQKLGLACTLVRTPDLLLLDEPSVGVDPLSRRDLWKIVDRLVREERLSVLVSTAYMDEAERCDQVCVMNQGGVLAQGTPASLIARSKGLTRTVRPPPGVSARAVQACLHDAPELVIDAVPRGGEVFLVHMPGVREADIAALVPGLVSFPRYPRLEDTFMLLLRQQMRSERHAEMTQRSPDEASLRTDSVPPPVTPLADRMRSSAQSPGTVSISAEKPAIAVRDLVRTFGNFTAVARTSFEVSRGEIFGLLGPNGAGKTTTFRMLCGLIPASSGSLEVAGVNLRTARARARARIGYVAQKFSLYANLSVSENLHFFGGGYGLRGRVLKRRVQTLMSQFSLAPDAVSGILPAGYRQRLAMAASLLHEPDILFLDEPTSGIDPPARRAFWRVITELAHQGVTVIVTTHFMEEAEYCDRIMIQDAGRMLAIGTPKEVRERAGGQSIDMNDAFIAIVEEGRKLSPDGAEPAAAARSGEGTHVH